MKRVDITGLALVGIAIAGLVVSHPSREVAARNYAEAVGYNRAVTGFVAANRDRFAGRAASVFGLSGLSPWSHTNGQYLTRLLGFPVKWRVYVPHADLFYSHGSLSNSVITVRPESAACEDGDRTVFVVFDERGEGAFASDCNDALARSHRPPTLERWWPPRVTPAMAASGFHLTLYGEHLGSAVTVAVEGKEVPVVRANYGRLMTLVVPASTNARAAVTFDLRHRGQTSVSGKIDVTDER